MKATLLEQILSRKGLRPDSFSTCLDIPVDHIYGHDRNTFKIKREIEEEFGLSLLDAKAMDKWRLFMDHYSPPSTLEVAALHIQQREIARAFPVFLSEVGGGVGHQVGVEKIVGCGQVVVGVDSHTCTVGGLGSLGLRRPAMLVGKTLVEGTVSFNTPLVMRIELMGSLPADCCAKDIALHLATSGPNRFPDKILEFGGSGLAGLSMSERFTLSNLSSDLGARAAIVETDEGTEAYLAALGRRHDFLRLTSTPSAYDELLEIDLSEMVPMVASPPNIFTSKPVRELIPPPRPDVVAIGSCTNGRYEDFVAFMSALGAGPIAPGIRLLATPASRLIYGQLLQDGIIGRLLDAGAIVNPPGCGPCMGLHQGILQDGEICLATGSQNGAGRMGSSNAQVFLAGPKVAGATARAGFVISA